MNLPMEPMWVGNEPRREPAACRRCGSAHIRDLGDAGSDLRWFACLACCHVWSVDDRKVTPDFGAPIPPHSRN